jgi:hypothetical protein
MPVGRLSCRPASPLSLARGVPETRGTTEGAVKLYGLLFSRLPLRTNEECHKIVWRMTGTGPFVATVLSPFGQARPLAQGPDHHDGSTYDRPGDEWGVGYRFPTPGCWHLHFQRGATHGDVWFQVKA